MTDLPQQWVEIREGAEAMETRISGKGKEAFATVLDEAPTDNVVILDEVTAAAAAAGLSSGQLQEALEKANAAIVQLGKSLGEAVEAIMEVVAAGVKELWPVLKNLANLLDEYKEQEDEDKEEDDSHDGAREILIVWIPRRQTIEMLYAQGADHGGPGPARLALIRVTDDGLRRAETGTNEERRPI